MKESQAVVQRMRHLGGNYQQLELAVADYLSSIKPGQSLLARPKSLRTHHHWNPYLRDLWYPFHVSRDKITVEIVSPHHHAPGDVFDLIAPIGQPYRFRRTLRNVLLIAYNTYPFPLLMTIPWLLGNQVSVTLVLLDSASDYPTNHLPPEVEVLRGDNPAEPLSWSNQVTSIGWADQAFVIVPPGDELSHFERILQLFRERRAEVGTNYLFGAFQSINLCGVGACDACLIRTLEGNRLACTEGPAFDLTTLKY